jgi:nicotinamide phosphoribosyltransferase
MRPDSGDVLEQAIRIYQVALEHDLLDAVGVIIGEGMNFEQVKRYDARLEAEGVPLTFVAYGIGSGFYNHIDRDTYGWAMKTAYSNGKDRMKFAMVALKRSIPGRVRLVRVEGELMAIAHEEEVAGEDVYETIYKHDGTGEPHMMDVGEVFWNEVRDRIRVQNPQQQAIKISAAIERKIAALAEQYL